MLAYIKSIKDFKTVFAAQVVDYDLPIATAGDDTGTIQLKADVAPGNEGNWMLFDGQVWIIQQIRVDSGISSLTLAAPITAFDRALPYTAPAASTEQFIVSMLTTHFKNIVESASAYTEKYKMDYLQIVPPETTTAFSAPGVDDSMLFTLPAYVQAVGETRYKEDGTVDVAGVVVAFSYSNTNLIINIHSSKPANHKIIFDTSVHQLKDRSHDQDTISKITFYNSTGGTLGTWYLTLNGRTAVLPGVGDPQLPGKWIAQTIPDESKPEQEQAAEIFAANKNSHKIEFYSREKLNLHDTVTMRLGDAASAAVETYKITCVRVASADNRYLYVCGDMAVTLTDKVRQIGASSGGRNAMPADYVVAAGTTGKWTYRKWASGAAECWGTFSTDELIVGTAWGSLYYGTWMNLAANKTARAYPFAFVDDPDVTAALCATGGDGWLAADTSNNTGTRKTHAPAFCVVRPTSGSLTLPQISYHVTGKWK